MLFWLVQFSSLLFSAHARWFHARAVHHTRLRTPHALRAATRARFAHALPCLAVLRAGRAHAPTLRAPLPPAFAASGCLPFAPRTRMVACRAPHTHLYRVLPLPRFLHARSFVARAFCCFAFAACLYPFCLRLTHLAGPFCLYPTFTFLVASPPACLVRSFSPFPLPFPSPTFTLPSPPLPHLPLPTAVPPRFVQFVHVWFLCRSFGCRSLVRSLPRYGSRPRCPRLFHAPRSLPAPCPAPRAFPTFAARWFAPVRRPTRAHLPRAPLPFAEFPWFPRRRRRPRVLACLLAHAHAHPCPSFSSARAFPFARLCPLPHPTFPAFTPCPRVLFCFSGVCRTLTLHCIG